MKSGKMYMSLGVATLLLSVLSCNRNRQQATTESGALSPQEARQIAKEAFIYGLPVVMNFETLHKQAVDASKFQVVEGWI